MIESVHFKNFKVLRDATLPLQRLTLIVGPNGSGKSTAIQGLLAIANRYLPVSRELWPVGAPETPGGETQVTAQLGERDGFAVVRWRASRAGTARWAEPTRRTNLQADLLATRTRDALRRLESTRAYFFQSKPMAAPAELEPEVELAEDGRNLAVVLDRIRDEAPERFEALNAELGRWLPEFDRVLFETPSPGHRSFALRTRAEQRPVQARNLSDGTLLALAMLCLAYTPDPPPVVCFEEPDHGLHPRLMRDVRDALHRLAYPENFGETREPVQVIATTHSPILLDLFRDHPEEVVIANKVGTEATFQRLSDIPNFEEILGECSLGDAWYTGILGGVPTEP